MLFLMACTPYEGTIQVGDKFVDLDSNPFNNDTIVILDIRYNDRNVKYIQYKHIGNWLKGEVRETHDKDFRMKYNNKIGENENN